MFNALFAGKSFKLIEEIVSNQGSNIDSKNKINIISRHHRGRNSNITNGMKGGSATGFGGFW